MFKLFYLVVVAVAWFIPVLIGIIASAKRYDNTPKFPLVFAAGLIMICAPIPVFVWAFKYLTGGMP